MIEKCALYLLNEGKERCLGLNVYQSLLGAVKPSAEVSYWRLIMCYC